MNKQSGSSLLWLAAVCFFAGIFIAQQYLVRQGSDLIPGAGGDFTLQSADGPKSLSDYRGKVVAVYFGYMSCPDICPTAMWNLTEALNGFEPEQLDAFLLHEEAGLTLPQIAEVTGVRRETVKSRLRYALKKLRDALGETRREITGNTS